MDVRKSVEQGNHLQIYRCQMGVLVLGFGDHEDCFFFFPMIFWQGKGDSLAGLYCSDNLSRKPMTGLS